MFTLNHDVINGLITNSNFREVHRITQTCNLMFLQAPENVINPKWVVAFFCFGMAGLPASTCMASC